MQNLVEIRNNQVVVSSRQVAKTFGREHKRVLRAVRLLLRSAQFGADVETSVQNWSNLFFEDKAPDSYGRMQKIYLMNRDGFALLVMGFSGEKALLWKMKYIAAFNEMEAKLREASASKQLPRAELPKPKKEYVRPGENVQYVELLEENKRKLIALEVILDRLTWAREKEELKGAIQLASDIAIGIGSRLYDLKAVKLPVYDQL